MELFILLFFDEIIMGIGYLLNAILILAVIDFVFSNLVKIMLCSLGIFTIYKIVKRTGKIGLITVIGIVAITLANFVLTDYLYNIFPNFRYSKDSGDQVIVLRCDSAFLLRDQEIKKGDILVLQVLNDSKKWNTSVDLYSNYKMSFYVEESVTQIAEMNDTTEIANTTKPVIDKLERDYKTLINSSNEKVKELIAQTQNDLDTIHSLTSEEQMHHYREQIVGHSFSDVREGRILKPGDIKERTILEFDEDEIHITKGYYKCVLNKNGIGFHWEENSIINVSTTTYNLERTWLYGVVVKTPSDVFKVFIDETYTVKWIEVYDD